MGLSKNIIFLFTIFIASLVEYFGDASFKLFNKYDSNFYLFTGILSYIVLVIMLIYILKYANVMHMNINWDAISVILETLLAYFLLKETLSSNYQIAGLIFIIIGLILMNFEGTGYK